MVRMWPCVMKKGEDKMERRIKKSMFTLFFYSVLLSVLVVVLLLVFVKYW